MSSRRTVPPVRATTIIAACSVSDEPPTVLACLNRHNPNNDLFVRNGNFALNTLAVKHEPMAVAFSGVTGLATEERFAFGHWDALSTGAPTLTDAVAVFDCELIDLQGHRHASRAFRPGDRPAYRR